MGKISSSADLANVEEFEDFKRFGKVFFSEVKATINGGIDIDNLRAAMVSVVFESSGLDTQVTHNLGVVPRGYIKISGPNVSVYDGDAASTDTNIFIKSTGAGTCSILVMG